eukprot:1349130-Pyramimonas_sp.AAC.1
MLSLRLWQRLIICCGTRGSAGAVCGAARVQADALSARDLEASAANEQEAGDQDGRVQDGQGQEQQHLAGAYLYQTTPNTPD